MPGIHARMSPLDVLQSFPPHGDTAPGLLRSRTARIPDAPWLAGDIRGWRYDQAWLASRLLACHLRALGAAKGDRIVLASLNSDLGALLLMASGHLGAVLVPINPALADAEISYLVGHCQPRIVVAQPEYAERMTGLAGTATVLDTRQLGDDAADARGVIDALLAMGHAPDCHLSSPSPEDPLVIIYTSGTTGFPKGVVHSHRNFVWSAEAFVQRMHLQPGERLMAILPFFHINALFYSLGGALACGGALVTTPRFSASRFWELAERSGATQLNILAAVGNILMRRPRSEYRPGHRIRKIYGGPISADMMQTFQREFHVPDLIEGYGMSEIPGAFNNPFDGVRKVGSIGLPARHPRLPGDFVQARIVDEQGHVLPPGEIGELQVRTPIAMLHYFRDPEQTRQAFDEGWLRTGDLVRRDEDGYYYFVARKKDIIRRRGENISGAELDRVLSGHPDVIEAATLGVPAALGDEDILAVVVPRCNPPPHPQELLDWCAQRVAAMKVPRYLVYRNELPHTASQRVAKFQLKQDASLLREAYDREATVP